MSMTTQDGCWIRVAATSAEAVVATVPTPRDTFLLNAGGRLKVWQFTRGGQAYPARFGVVTHGEREPPGEGVSSRTPALPCLSFTQKGSANLS